MNKHSSRDPRTGRFSPSGAPIPDSDGQGDTSFYDDVTSPSADPQDDYRTPVITRYAEPVHDLAHGGYHRPIEHRKQFVINAETGQELSDRITDVRAVQSHIGGRTQTHVVTVDGEPEFWSESVPQEPEHGYARSQAGANGYRLPSTARVVDQDPYGNPVGR